MLICVVPVPPVLAALIVKVMALEITEGVPERTQALERLSPAGRAGEAEQLTIEPPVFTGVCAVIATFFVNVKGMPP